MKSFLAGLLFTIAFQTPATAQSSDADAVSQATASLMKAMVAASATDLERVTLPQLSYGHAGGQVQNQREFIAGATSGRVVFRDIKVSRPVLLIDGDIALDRHLATYHVEIGGKTSTTDVEILHVWRKRDGQWRLFARQAFKAS